MRPDRFEESFTGRNGIRSANVVEQLRVEVLVPRYRVGDARAALHDQTSRDTLRTRTPPVMRSC